MKKKLKNINNKILSLLIQNKMSLYRLVVTNNSPDYSLVTGLVYNYDCVNVTEQTNPIGTFTLELTQFPNIKSGLPGSPFVTKYEYQINLDHRNDVQEMLSNSNGFSVMGTYKLNSGTFMNLSPLGMPFGKYLNQTTNIGWIDLANNGKVIMNIEKNDTDGYLCTVQKIS